MIKKFIFSLVKFVSGRMGKKVVIINDSGSIINNTASLSKHGFWYAGNVFDTSDISYGIAMNGEVEKEETNLVIKILNYFSEKGDFVFYDIGANSGYYGILSAFLYKQKSKVFSFEPLREYTDCIKKSVYLNKLDNLEIFEFALGDKSQEKTMYIAGSGSTFNKDFSGKDVVNERSIKIKKLDDIVSSNKINFPDFIKIDVEGHELKVFNGAKNTIKENLPVIFVEIAYTMNGLGRSYENKNFKETFDFLEEIGYRTYSINNSKLEEFDSNEKPDGVNMYLFLHKNKHKDLINNVINILIIN